MPIHHSRTNLTLEEKEMIKSYRRNDVLATYEVYKLIRGRTTHPEYAGKDLLLLRFDLEEEFGIDCRNYADIKIGDEIVKQAYMKEKGINIDQLPKKGTFRREIKLRECIPDYIKFESKQLQKLLKSLKSRVISQTDELEEQFDFYGTKYTIGLGGLHSVNKDEIYRKCDLFELHDYDCSSMYPATIVNNSFIPKHLGLELLRSYDNIFKTRVRLKPLAKKDNRIKGKVEAYKLALNAVYGKLGSMESWLYDKKCLLSVTLTGQLGLFMLIEMYELAGIHVFSANTDGITVRVPIDKLEEIKKINKAWEAITKHSLERTDYDWIIYSNVNSYIAKKTGDPEIKKKSEFLTDFEVHKNKSARVVPLALEEYFVNGTHPSDFIKNHKNIYDFCIMTRAMGRMHLEEQWLEDGAVKTKQHKKLIRFYLSDTGIELYKRGIGKTDKIANISVNAENQVGKQTVQYFNQFEEREDYNIDYNQYIYRALKLIDKVEKTRKCRNFIENIKPKGQMSLF